MEITNFVNLDFITSFIGAIIAVELIVFTTKNWFLIRKIPTKAYTLLIGIIHLLITQVLTGTTELTIINIYLLIINALIIACVLCGGYDFAVGKINIAGLTLDKKE